MNDADIFLIEARLLRLNADYWYDVDLFDGAHAHEFFVVDGIFTTSLRSRQGHAEIAAFYRGRQDGRIRTARHVVTNQRVHVQDSNHASVDSILLLYAADGAPVLPSENAIMIADMHDVCCLAPDGHWQYVSRTISAVFKSSTPTTG